jgi:hypothetical protein
VYTVPCPYSCTVEGQRQKLGCCAKEGEERREVTRAAKHRQEPQGTSEHCILGKALMYSVKHLLLQGCPLWGHHTIASSPNRVRAGSCK